MSTTEVVNVPAESNNDSSMHITTSPATYRTYGAFDADGKARGVKKTKKKDADGQEFEEVAYEGLPSVLAETATKKNWDEAEKRGATVLTENAYKFYSLSDLAGFDTLIPSAEQRLYIIQRGMDVIQNAAVAAFQTELEEKNSKDDPDVYSHNGETIDLRGSLNTPRRKNLSDEEKFMKAVGSLPQEKVLAMLAAYKQAMEAASA
jgi:hypothetical protein